MALGYKVALTSVWWNRGGLDARLFSTKSEQQIYFTNLGLYYNELNNFNINDNITTTIIFRDKSGRSIDELLKCNYAIVWNTKANSYRYYHIVDIRADSNNQVIATLDLDDIQTNLIGNTTRIKNIYVRQWTGANLLINNNTYEMLPSEENLLATGDFPPQFNQATQELFFKYTTDDDINAWLNENVAYWRYIFAVQNNQLKAPIISDTSLVDLIVNISALMLENNQGITLPYSVFAVPIYKKNSSKKIYIKYNYSGERWGVLNYNALDSLFTTITGNGPIGTYCIQEKVSNICPYNTKISTSSFSIDLDGDLVISNAIDMTNKYVLGQAVNYYLGGSELGQNIALTKENANGFFISGSFQRDTTIECEIDNPIKMSSLSEAEAKETATKLLDANYSTFVLRIGSQKYSYNPLALIKENTDKLSLQYTEVLQAGVSKIYVRFSFSEEIDDYKNYYTDANTKDYTGLVASLDFSVPLLTNQWADYLANNKNYYLQTAFNNTIGLVQGAFSPNSKGGQGLTRGFSAGVNLVSNVFNQQLERENMQQAPDGLSNGNGDPYFNVSIDGIKPKVDYLTISNEERKIVLNKMKMEGVPKNRIYSQLSDILNIHINYDIVNCVLTYNSLGISTKEHERLRDRLGNNIRYWYNDDVDLEALNYIP